MVGMQDIGPVHRHNFVASHCVKNDSTLSVLLVIGTPSVRLRIAS